MVEFLLCVNNQNVKQILFKSTVSNISFGSNFFKYIWHMFFFLEEVSLKEKLSSEKHLSVHDADQEAWG